MVSNEQVGCTRPCVWTRFSSPETDTPGIPLSKLINASSTESSGSEQPGAFLVAAGLAASLLLGRERQVWLLIELDEPAAASQVGHPSVWGFQIEAAKRILCFHILFINIIYVCIKREEKIIKKKKIVWKRPHDYLYSHPS